jgi:predicted nucleic acid-binding protein
MNTSEAKKIVKNCYVDILNRNPDEIGLNYYVDLLVREKIDSSQLVVLLKSSKEFLDKQPQTMQNLIVVNKNLKKLIRFHYNDLLEREPDEIGLNYYVDLLRRKQINEPQLIEIIKNCPEYLEINPIENSKITFSEKKDYSKNSDIIAMYRIKNESRWIEQSLKSILDICKEIVIVDDGSTDDTIKICENFPQVVEIHSQKNLPFDETRDKNTLLKMALSRNPDFILTLDGDEVFMPNSKQRLFYELNVLYPNVNLFQLKALYVWDKPNQYRWDGIYNNTWSKKLFRLKDQPENLQFATTDFPGNSHCSAFPDNLIGKNEIVRSKVKFLHYGYYDEELRREKYDFLNKLDPNNVNFDGYKHILSGNSKYAGSDGIEFRPILKT